MYQKWCPLHDSALYGLYAFNTDLTATKHCINVLVSQPGKIWYSCTEYSSANHIFKLSGPFFQGNAPLMCVGNTSLYIKRQPRMSVRETDRQTHRQTHAQCFIFLPHQQSGERVSANVPIRSIVRTYICLQIKGLAFCSSSYCMHVVAAMQRSVSSKTRLTCLMITIMLLHSPSKCSLSIDIRDVFQLRMPSTWNKGLNSLHIHTEFCGCWTFELLYKDIIS